jgi:hypothetical protein
MASRTAGIACYFLPGVTGSILPCASHVCPQRSQINSRVRTRQRDRFEWHRGQVMRTPVRFSIAAASLRYFKSWVTGGEYMRVKVRVKRYFRSRHQSLATSH